MRRVGATGGESSVQLNFLGKLVGSLAGMATGKWFLALLGLALGHQFDRGYARHLRRRLPSAFVSVAFSAMGHLEAQLRELRDESNELVDMGKTLVAFLLPVLLLKQDVSGAERRVLWQVAQTFSLSRVDVAQMEARARLGRHFQSPQEPTNRDTAVLALETLGVRADASNADIKKAYRRLMNRYHPDKLAAGASADEIESAGRKTREVREAYELLRARRGFK